MSSSTPGYLRSPSRLLLPFLLRACPPSRLPAAASEGSWISTPSSLPPSTRAFAPHMPSLGSHIHDVEIPGRDAVGSPPASGAPPERRWTCSVRAPEIGSAASHREVGNAVPRSARFACGSVRCRDLHVVDRPVGGRRGLRGRR